ncbi:hypothetical protein Tco_0960690 [Tanacetum coccineum]
MVVMIDGDDVIVETTTTTTTTAITDVEITLAQALAELKSAKPKADKVVIQEPEQGTTTPTHTTTTAAITITTVSTRPRAKGLVIHEQEKTPTPTFVSQQPSQSRLDKGKGQIVEQTCEENVKEDYSGLMKNLPSSYKLKKKKKGLPEKVQQLEEANIAWDDVHAKIDADYQLAQRLQAQEQDELTDEEKARLFVQFLEQRRKHFAAKRAEEKRNRPPTRAQQRSIINEKGEYLVDYRTELVEESSKKAEIEQEESSKKAEAEIAQ